MDNKGLLEKVKSDINKNSLLDSGAKIVIGVSGGADSVCLLKVLLELKNDFDLELFVIHVNHRLRGQEADQEQAYVMELCKDLGIQSKSYGVNIRAVSKKQGISEEEAGRNVRYKIFSKALKNMSFDYIAVAHNRDDQAETVMLNLLRGTGLDGLCGISIKQGRIIRPLLNISRKEIEEYLTDNKISYCTDSSNISEEYTRNRIRNNLFPKIKELFDVDLSNNLYKLSALVRVERDYLENEAKKHYSNVALSESILGSDKDEVVISASSLIILPIAIVKRIIRLAWERINSSRKNLEAVHVDQIISLCQNNRTGKKVELPNDIEVKISYDRLIFSKGGKKKYKPFSHTVVKEGLTRVNEIGGALESKILTKDEFLKIERNENENSLTQFFDFEAFEGEIYIRSRLQGDRIRPYKAKGEKKLKEYFIDQKIPKENRDLIPLIAQGNKIAWVVGMRTSEEFRPREDSKKIWMLSWRYIDNGGAKYA